MAKATEEAIVTSKEDTELFVIDTVGSKSARRKVTKEVKKQESGVVSSTDAKLVAKRLAQQKNKEKPKEAHCRCTTVCADGSIRSVP